MKVMKLLKGVGKIRKRSFNLIKASIKFPNINTMKLPVFVTLCQKKRELNSLAKEKSSTYVVQVVLTSWEQRIFSELHCKPEIQCCRMIIKNK
jgi:hypothetical protein